MSKDEVEFGTIGVLQRGLDKHNIANGNIILAKACGAVTVIGVGCGAFIYINHQNMLMAISCFLIIYCVSGLIFSIFGEHVSIKSYLKEHKYDGVPEEILMVWRTLEVTGLPCLLNRSFIVLLFLSLLIFFTSLFLLI